ncbi:MULTISPECIES: Zn-ribbon domain-containing OB-fold protein [Haloprofundus]|uniref:Zn-ribbon domain-containing OB-fold protein n=1 Tax=Haloprofundus TaxID=1911573 RepID=UPI000E44886B|nr:MULTISPECIES: OB-fold domain-containing protein [Haloprofundus]QCJ47643.1 nucleic acid-binding protein [Haloprofundus sp. MHR1]
MADSGYDEWIAAVEAGEGYYLECPEGHGSLPPRRTCPHCGALELGEEPLPESGTVETYSVVHVAAPSFQGDTPYATAVVDFGPVRLTGVVRGVEFDDLEVGTAVGVTVEEHETTGDPVVVFRRR